MALIKRISRLFSADLHAVLDQIEEPQALLRQAIREMEEELAKQMQRIKWVQSEIATARARRSALSESLKDVDAKLDLCIAAGNDDLARRLTRRKLQSSRLQQQISEKTESLESMLASEQASIAEHQDQLEGMRQKAELLAEAAPHGGRDFTSMDADGWISDDEIEVAFLQEKQARSQS